MFLLSRNDFQTCVYFFYNVFIYFVILLPVMIFPLVDLLYVISFTLQCRLLNVMTIRRCKNISVSLQRSITIDAIKSWTISYRVTCVLVKSRSYHLPLPQMRCDPFIQNPLLLNPLLQLHHYCHQASNMHFPFLKSSMILRIRSFSSNVPKGGAVDRDGILQFSLNYKYYEVALQINNTFYVKRRFKVQYLYYEKLQLIVPIMNNDCFYAIRALINIHPCQCYHTFLARHVSRYSMYLQ